MRNEQVRVPGDVTAYVNKKRAVRIAVLALIETVLLIILIFFGDDIFSGAHPAVSYVIFGGLMTAPVFLLEIPFWVFDKTWAGEIISKSEDTYIGPDDNRQVRTGRLVVKKIQKLNIRLDSGKEIEHTVYDNRARHAYRHNTYNVGDRVIHVGGTRYIQAVAVGDDDTLICVICGAESRADMPTCQVCGKTLKID